MTPTERFSVLITLMSIAVTAMLSMLAVAVRDHFALKDLVSDVAELVKHKEADHNEMKTRLSQLERDQLEFYRNRGRR